MSGVAGGEASRAGRGARTPGNGRSIEAHCATSCDSNPLDADTASTALCVPQVLRAYRPMLLGTRANDTHTDTCAQVAVQCVLAAPFCERSLPSDLLRQPRRDVCNSNPDWQATATPHMSWGMAAQPMLMRARTRGRGESLSNHTCLLRYQATLSAR